MRFTQLVLVSTLVATAGWKPHAWSSCDPWLRGLQSSWHTALARLLCITPPLESISVACSGRLTTGCEMLLCAWFHSVALGWCTPFGNVIMYGVSSEEPNAHFFLMTCSSTVSRLCDSLRFFVFWWSRWESSNNVLSILIPNEVRSQLGLIVHDNIALFSLA